MPSPHKDSTDAAVKSRASSRKPFQDASIVAPSAEETNKSTDQSDPLPFEPADNVDAGLGGRENQTGVASIKARTLPRRPRPSLSDRTIETLYQIPPSPSPRRRKSSFFPPESPSQSPSRPASSLNKSRPGTSHGQHFTLPSGFPTPRPISPTKTHLASGTGNRGPKATTSKRSVSSYNSKILSEPSTEPYGATNPLPSKSKAPPLNSVRGSKTVAARPSKTRPTVQDVFTNPLKPSGRYVGTKRSNDGEYYRPDPPPILAGSSEDLRTATSESKRLLKTSPPSDSSATTSQSFSSPKMPNSSAALRETIAKAKTARRNANNTSSKGSSRTKLQPEPFEIGEIDDCASVLRNRVATARTGGRLNIAALGLKEMPAEVLNMYNSNLGSGAWYESVDLIRLIAADNDFENLDDAVFTDEAADSHETDEDYQGSLFGGLEALDLHNNHLRSLPMGLRRLERLTTLNLSKNALGNDTLTIIGQIQSLRELRLANNALKGLMGPELGQMKALQILDLQDNAISNLPINLHQLCNLRVLAVAGNRLESLPLECFSTLPLSELNAARNRLGGSLFPPQVKELKNLKHLDVAKNALIVITENKSVRLPSLQSFDVTENRLAEIPDISSWTELHNLGASGNRISDLPVGLTGLTQLRTIDVTRNDIRRLDERLGLMDCLTVLRIANNPLRERRFLNLDTSEVKRELKHRLLSEEPAGNEEKLEVKDVVDTHVLGKPQNARKWTVKPGGILDRSSTELATLEPSDLDPFSETEDVKTMILGHNQLQMVPSVIGSISNSLSSLDISHNKLSGVTYMPKDLVLSGLRSLNLSFNAISALSPLIDQLSAPQLTELNVSRNRLTSLPTLRLKFPSLISVLVANNIISTLEADTVRGLHILDISGNEISHLEPKLGLLGTEGLRTLLVGGNTFRVPRREIVDKGTQAVLSWLRTRIPEGDL